MRNYPFTQAYDRPEATAQGTATAQTSAEQPAHIHRQDLA